MFNTKKWLVFISLGILLVSVFYLVRPKPLNVEVVAAGYRDFILTVEEQGRTRAKDPFIVATPITGRLLRSELNEGDLVIQGQVIARIALPPNDSRTEAFSQAQLNVSLARYSSIEAALMEAESTYAIAMQEQQRRDELFKEGLTSSEERDDYQQASLVADARRLSLQASLKAAEAEIESAQSLLIGVDWDNEGSIQNVLAPVNGTIYQVYEESERVITAGTRLFSISNDDALEIVIDLPTQDAVQVKVDDTILVTGWGGQQTIEAVVNYIEPQAYTKISALGVEEQRVNIIGSFIDEPSLLGAEYRIDAAIVTREVEDVLSIPGSAIFQQSNGWFTYVVRNNKAELRAIDVGLRTQEYAQILSGIAEGENVIIYPSDLIENDVKVSY